MKVKVGGKVYDGKNKPVMVILTKWDKENITNMLPSATKYCEYPVEKYSVKQIEKWMKG